MPDDINCQIEECDFNNRMGGCRATNIQVLSSVEDRVCNQSESTCCETFKPRD